MAARERHVRDVEGLKEALRKRVASCTPTCSWILEDLELHGHLTSWPKDYFGTELYPVDGKVRHLELEGLVKFL